MSRRIQIPAGAVPLLQQMGQAPPAPPEPVELPLLEGGRFCFHPEQVRGIREILEDDAADILARQGIPHRDGGATELHILGFTQPYLIDMEYERFLALTQISPQRADDGPGPEDSE